MRISGFKVNNGKVITEENIKLELLKYGMCGSIVLVGLSGNVSAASNVKEGLKPLISALQDLAEPVAYCFMIYGGLKMASGHNNEGQKILKSAIGGYVFIQWIPWIFDIIKGVGVGR